MFNEISSQFGALLLFGLILLFGYLGGKVANLLKLPKVTGYIIIGVLLEPTFLGILSQDVINHSDTISNFALCIITYAIGGSLHLDTIKKRGKVIGIMTVTEAVLTFVVVTLGIYIALPFVVKYLGVNIKPEFYLPFAVLVGALAAPTDPTPTLAVKEEYKADGPVTTTILGIGALDDAMGLIIFSVAMSVCVAVLGGSGGNFVGTAIIAPIAKIFFSLLIGAILAIFLVFSARKVEDKGVLVVMILGALFTCYGIAHSFQMDELLSTMTLGCIVANMGKDGDKFFISVRNYLEETIFVVFFVLAGAHLQLSILKNCLWLVLIFVILRMCGKFFGAYIGATVSKAQSNVKKYTALGLVPQGGIIVGLALLVKENSLFNDIAPILLNVILGTTVLFEFMGPLLTEFALKRANEVGKLQRESI